MKALTILASRFIIALAIASTLFLTGCPEDNPVNPNVGSGEIKTGHEVSLKSQIISNSGGKIVISGSGTSLDGMELEIPQSSYSISKNFSIAYSDISSHSFGSNFNPITPLIKIDNGGAYSDDLMTLKIPVKLEPGEFAMAFYFDSQTGLLEGIPIMKADENSITVGTRHFSGVALSKSNKGFNQIGKNGGDKILGGDWANIVVSKISKSMLSGEINTGFQPGKDDWEFPNIGSFLAPGGQCTGMSATAIWYYNNIRDPQLYGAYNQGSKKEYETNPLGVRFASEVWCDMNWVERSKWYDSFIGYATAITQNKDSINYYAFAYSMLLTKKPQLTEIWRTGGGHAMIIYKCNNGELFIADPNFPNNSGGITRKIKIQNGAFTPYESKQNAEDAAVTYPTIWYVATSALVPFDKIASRWEEFNNKSIGTRFPEYKIHVIEAGEWAYELSNGLNTDDDTLEIDVEFTSGTSNFKSPDDRAIQLFNSNGTLLDPNLDYGQIPLKPGLNKIGVAVYSKPKKNCIGTNYNGNSYRFIDLKWYEITRQSIDIFTTENNGAPILSPGEPSKEYTFKVNTMGSLKVSDCKFEWYFDDIDNNPTVISGDSLIKHKFEKSGNFLVEVKIYDKSNKLAAEAKVLAKIAGAFPRLYIIIHDPDSPANDGPVQWSDGYKTNTLFFMNAKSGLDPVLSPLVWNGNKFSCSYSGTIDDNSAYTISETGTCSGELSSDRKKLINLNWTKIVKIKMKDMDYTSSAEQQISLANVPIEATYQYAIIGTYGAYIKGNSAAQYLKSISGTADIDYEGNKRHISGINWGIGDTHLAVIFGDK